jgi:hypothetical protein
MEFPRTTLRDEDKRLLPERNAKHVRQQGMSIIAHLTFVHGVIIIFCKATTTDIRGKSFSLYPSFSMQSAASSGYGDDV